MVVTAAARHVLGAVFKRGIPARRLDDGLHGGFGQHAAAKVRVDNHAGGVDDAAQARAQRGKRAVAGGFQDGLAVNGKHALTHAVDGAARAVDQHGAGDDVLKRLERRGLHKLFDLRQGSQQVGTGFGHGSFFRYVKPSN